MATRCKICNKSVYANDPQLKLDATLLHKTCAKCADCSCQITLSNFAKHESADSFVLLCKVHYFKRFHEEGSYLGADKFKMKQDREKVAGANSATAATTVETPTASNNTTPLKSDAAAAPVEEEPVRPSPWKKLNPIATAPKTEVKPAATAATELKPVAVAPVAVVEEVKATPAPVVIEEVKSTPAPVAVVEEVKATPALAPVAVVEAPASAPAVVEVAAPVEETSSYSSKELEFQRPQVKDENSKEEADSIHDFGEVGFWRIAPTLIE